ncbi:MAG TPA: trypsin-like peptidase domain-containing protein [Chloroflexota bacterium]|nr:trypsin-like peptidase domain-containing protein [Chloroflexota bacterium]
MTDNPLVQLSAALASAVETAARSVVTVHARQRVSSSGTIWQPGVVVTAAHTIETEDIAVTLPDGRQVKAQLAGSDGGTDISVLRVEADLPALTPAENPAGVGSLALAVARPEHLSATMGVISHWGGAWRSWSGGRLDALIRADLTLYPGFSGGPLIGADGTLLGINTSGLTRGLPVAVPAATVKRVADQLLKHGRVARGYLGVGLQPVRLNEDQAGLVVVSLEPEGPAAKAGVIVGDVLTAIAGKPVQEHGAVRSALDSDSIGKPVEVSLLRGGQPQTVSVTVGERGE